MKNFYFTLLLAVFANEIHAQIGKLDQIKWMTGEWVMNTGDMKFIEHWQPVSNTHWQGGGYGITATGDTAFSEVLQISVKNDTVWYLPTISHQNEGKQVKFACTELNNNKAVFENKLHDFPQHIVYNKTSDSTIYAYVEGIQKGRLRKEEFNFKRK